MTLACPERRGIVHTAVFWLGPEEFLVVGPTNYDSLGSELIQRLLTELGDGEGQVVDLSANRTTFELSGPRSCAMLEKGYSLDLNTRVFKAWTAISTEMAASLPSCGEPRREQPDLPAGVL